MKYLLLTTLTIGSFFIGNLKSTDRRDSVIDISGSSSSENESSSEDSDSAYDSTSTPPRLSSPGKNPSPSESLSPIPEIRKATLVGLLGAPAAGKSFSFTQLEKWGIDLFKSYSTADTFTNLTVDILRDEILRLPPIMQFDLFVKSYEWFHSNLRRHTGTSISKKIYRQWLLDSAKLIDELNHHSRRRFRTAKDLMPLIEIDKGKLVFKIGTEIVPFLSFLSTVDHVKLPHFLSQLLHKKGTVYNSLKRMVRFYQEQKMFEARGINQNVFLDETGGNVEQFQHMLQHFREYGYLNVLVTIHHESILVNLMQNASRMVKGSDGGRDSSTSIVEAYREMEVALPVYKSLTPEDAYFVIKNDDDKRAVVEYFQSGRINEVPEGSGKLIDAFILVQNATVEATRSRIEASLREPAELRLFEALVMLHLKNPKKGGPLNLADQFASTLTDEEALQAIKTAAESKKYNGITTLTVKEAQAVFGEK